MTNRKEHVIIKLQSIAKRKDGGALMRNYLVTLRKEKNLTQKQLAEKLDISESYYNQIENRERQKRMDITVIDRLSKALGISASDIIRHESEFKED
ncbi:MAG: helix-turn-helix transcriptional regulator [Bacteroides sp.]|nr:helix-turn-helix transcriptional regulator [Eubacterium sp.]MCM1419733.1 helix-turn-helix transcriptional regulator [Roseburia sp.]MCM1463708.1 helix-turn-helix transcriptional regulator [Bacteroides sp.]